MYEQAKSNKILGQAKKVIPFKFASNDESFSHSPFIARGRDSRIVDVDNNSYIDYVCSDGNLILGHANYRVVSAIRDIALNGFAFDAPYPLEVELARLISETVPSVEQVLFVNSAQEAQNTAVRIARAYTRKDYIIQIFPDRKFHEATIEKHEGSAEFPNPKNKNFGIPFSTSNLTLFAKYNDIKFVEKLIKTHKEKIAAIIVEPIPTYPDFTLPDKTFLSNLHNCAKANDILLVFNEIKSGFRISLGGAQALFEVKPDLTIFGSLIGGGLPLGALGGKHKLMNLTNFTRSDFQHHVASNPLSLAAGIETIKELLKPDTYTKLEDLGQHLENGFNWIKNELALPLEIKRIGSLFSLSFPIQKLPLFKTSSYKFYSKMLSLGHYIPIPNSRPWYVSLAHTKKEIESTVDAANETLGNLSILS
jgi:glutamate-1-semialdehyde 2,1-aminomutase